MSPATAEAEPAPPALPASPVRPLRVLSIVLGCAALAGLVYALARPSAREVDAGAAWERLFASPRPEGYVLASALELPDGSTALTFVDPDAGIEPPKPAVPEMPEPAEGQPPPKGEWHTLPIGSPGPRARELVFLTAERHASLAALFEKTRGGGGPSARDLGPQGGTVTVDGGRIAWAGLDAPFVHERTFEPGGTFRDAVRVNLSTAARPCVLHASWTRGVAGSKQETVRLLERLTPP